MIERGTFDTDKRALDERIQAHDRFGSRDLNQWIFSNLQPAKSHRVLELGSGTGKQSLPLAEIVGPHGRVQAVDASAESLDSLLAAASAQSLRDRISVLHSSFEHLDPERVLAADRALASYSLYYARDPERLVALVRHKLATGGRFFFCGPASDNNLELRAFHHDLLGEPVAPTDAGEFMERLGPAIARRHFGRAARVEFENPLTFDSLGALLSYWRSYNLYEPTLDERFASAAERHFAEHGVFVTTKRVIGIISSV